MSAAAVVLLLLLDGGAGLAPPRLAVEPTAFDFGRIKAGRRVDKELVLRNHGGQALEIASIATTCGCAVVSDYAKTVKAGGRTVLRVAFTAPAKAGRTEQRVLVKTNDPERPAVEVKLSAEVVAATAR